jgi:hypothetical protein
LGRSNRIWAVTGVAIIISTRSGGPQLPPPFGDTPAMHEALHCFNFIASGKSFSSSNKFCSENTSLNQF